MGYRLRFNRFVTQAGYVKSNRWTIVAMVFKEELRGVGGKETPVVLFSIVRVPALFQVVRGKAEEDKCYPR